MNGWQGSNAHIYEHTHMHTHAVRGEERGALVKTAFMDHSHLHKEGQLYESLRRRARCKTRDKFWVFLPGEKKAKSKV